MSRIGNKVINIPAGVTIDVADGNNVTVKGPKGQLNKVFNSELVIKVEENTIVVERPNETKTMKSLHGTTRALLSNMVVGVFGGYKKILEMNGVGYRGSVAGGKLTLSLGFSHPVEFEIPSGLAVDVTRVGNINTINIVGIDKEAVGQFAAEIRAKRKPEPYLGKGIRYSDERIRRKEGKTAKK